ncbi:MAG: hypothetical protein CL678_10210 [Bdellovibrionaceae bacterium]|nr:hypothetical protein [Pseudobdellovibrionaceae bacterium]
MSHESRQPVLIANRGEIAIRIARTCRALGFPTVGVYSDADRFAEHVRYCDHSYWIGGSSPSESYLNIERLIVAAKAAGAHYIHPGYGFLSERAEFVEACQKAGLVFVGPSANSIRLMGDKITARQTIDELMVPRVPGSPGVLKDAEEAKKLASEMKYPVLLKAKAGGGGKGMRRVDSENEILSAFEGATREAQNAFGDGSLYIEKFILEPHHVEIQVFGDGKGKAIHLGERECSIQRRHQKVWEEAGAPILNEFPETRKKMQEAAVRVAEHISYAGAGTFEFLVDKNGDFYFLEMNTRLQVEHPVSEWVTGVDLVSWQLQLASGEFHFPKQSPEMNGHSIEVRIYAEDPKSFLPAPGGIGKVLAPGGPFVRWDSAFTERGEVSMFYDPMIAKLSTWGRSRKEALSRLQVALDEIELEPFKKPDGIQVGSLKTNLDFLKKLSRLDRVERGDTTTDLIDTSPELKELDQSEISKEAAIGLSLFQLLVESEGTRETESYVSESPWLMGFRQQILKGKTHG